MSEANSQYVVTEQGDLGLGLTPIDEKYVGENGQIQSPELKFGNVDEN